MTHKSTGPKSRSQVAGISSQVSTATELEKFKFLSEIYVRSMVGKMRETRARLLGLVGIKLRILNANRSAENIAESIRSVGVFRNEQIENLRHKVELLQRGDLSALSYAINMIEGQIRIQERTLGQDLQSLKSFVERARVRLGNDVLSSVFQGYVDAIELNANGLDSSVRQALSRLPSSGLRAFYSATIRNLGESINSSLEFYNGIRQLIVNSQSSLNGNTQTLFDLLTQEDAADLPNQELVRIILAASAAYNGRAGADATLMMEIESLLNSIYSEFVSSVGVTVQAINEAGL